MNINDLKDILDDICIPGLAESWDNSGYQIKIHDGNINKIMVAMEITDAVIDEAISVSADVIVTHHPLIFTPVKEISNENIPGRYITKLIQNKISVISEHTNFDKVDGGNNDYIGKLMGIGNIRYLGDDEGYCRTGSFDEPVALKDVAHLISERFNIDEAFFHVIGNPERKIKSLAWCSGAGSEFIVLAASKGIDLFITGDVKYHTAQMASELGISVIDAGHYGTEIIFVDNMAEKLSEYTKKNKMEIEIVKSSVDINPYRRVEDI